MMSVTEIKELPEDLPLFAWGQKEFDSTPPKERELFVKRSQHVWTLHDGGELLMVVGVYQPNLVGDPPELWVLLCRNFKNNFRRNLLMVRDKMEELLELYPRVMVQVDAEFPAGNKFAMFMGFTQVRSQRLVNDREYIVYEVTR